ncbi:hypothetical protein [Kutzneria sp. 744]|uniref:hypothetical protein n=1 Tax=Kutzneria sp. (strain 744) TaxID=345341 RepID=UPI0003EEAC1C|nr:hypothetical protein [Kutzneria sp. 744]EWM15908.1 hypothetical protein KUTG_06212 [Kutzneria sp. 744]
MSREIAAPGPVRAAGALVTVQGIAAVVVAIVTVVLGLSGGAPALVAFGEAGVYVVIAAAFLVPGILLWRGTRGARNGAVFLQLLVLGGIWWGFDPIDSLAVDILFTAYCLAVLVLLLFLASSRAWAMGITEEDGATPEPRP